MATKVGDLFAELNLKAKKALEDLDKFVGGLNMFFKDAAATVRERNSFGRRASLGLAAGSSQVGL